MQETHTASTAYETEPRPCLDRDPYEPAGPGRPPKWSRFKPGQSGNPAGRPRRAALEARSFGTPELRRALARPFLHKTMEGDIVEWDRHEALVEMLCRAAFYDHSLEAAGRLMMIMADGWAAERAEARAEDRLREESAAAHAAAAVADAATDRALEDKLARLRNGAPVEFGSEPGAPAEECLLRLTFVDWEGERGGDRVNHEALRAAMYHMTQTAEWAPESFEPCHSGCECHAGADALAGWRERDAAFRSEDAARRARLAGASRGAVLPGLPGGPPLSG